MSLSATLRPKSVNSIFPERPPGTIRFNARQYCPEFRIRLRAPVLLAKSTPTDSSVSLESSINSLANSSELYFIPLFNSSNFLILNNTPSTIPLFLILLYYSRILQTIPQHYIQIAGKAFLTCQNLCE